MPRGPPSGSALDYSQDFATAVKYKMIMSFHNNTASAIYVCGYSHVCKVGCQFTVISCQFIIHQMPVHIRA